MALMCEAVNWKRNWHQTWDDFNYVMLEKRKFLIYYGDILMYFWGDVIKEVNNDTNWIHPDRIFVMREWLDGHWNYLRDYGARITYLWIRIHPEPKHDL